MITVVIKVFCDYKIQTFFFTFCCGDWVNLGPLKLSRIDPVCSSEDSMKSLCSQSRPEADHTFPNGRACVLIDHKRSEDNFIRTESNLLPLHDIVVADAIFYAK